MSELSLMWLLFFILSTFAAIFIILPFIKRANTPRVNFDANAELISIYQQSLEKLTQEFSEDILEQSQYEGAVIDLKRRLLDELSDDAAMNHQGSNLIFAAMGLSFLIVMSVIFYGYTGSQKQIASWYRAVELLPSLGERAMSQQGEPLSANELQAFALGLRTKLAENGDDSIAWMLLGRVAMSLNDNEMAKQAFEKALKMEPSNLNVLVNYSQVLLIEGAESSINRAAAMLSKVLQRDPQNMDAISLLALIALEREDWKEAKSAFEVLLASVTQDDPRYNVILERIQTIKQKINDKVKSKAQPDESSSVSLTVAISLNPSIKNQLPNDATLFVFAKAYAGPEIPLAVNKLKHFEFPIAVTIDDSMAMLPELKLSNFDEVIVTARISSDEIATAQAGDLEGQSDIIHVESSTPIVLVEINRVITSTGS